MVAEAVTEHVVLTPQLREVEWRGGRERLTPLAFGLVEALVPWSAGRPCRLKALSLALYGVYGDLSRDRLLKLIDRTRARLPGLIAHRNRVGWWLDAATEIRGPAVRRAEAA